MTKLKRRLERLEARFTDSSRLMPHTEAWFKYWTAEVYRLFVLDEPGDPGKRIPIEIFDALLKD